MSEADSSVLPLVRYRPSQDRSRHPWWCRYPSCRLSNPRYRRCRTGSPSRRWRRIRLRSRPFRLTLSAWYHPCRYPSTRWPRDGHRDRLRPRGGRQFTNRCAALQFRLQTRGRVPGVGRRQWVQRGGDDVAQIQQPRDGSGRKRAERTCGRQQPRGRKPSGELPNPFSAAPARWPGASSNALAMPSRSPAPRRVDQRLAVDAAPAFTIEMTGPATASTVGNSRLRYRRDHVGQVLHGVGHAWESAVTPSTMFSAGGSAAETIPVNRAGDVTGCRWFAADCNIAGQARDRDVDGADGALRRPLRAQPVRELVLDDLSG